MRRYAERFDCELGRKEYEVLCRRIQSGQGEYLEAQSRRVTVWRLDEVIAVYDRQRKRIVTFLTEEMWDENMEEENYV